MKIKLEAVLDAIEMADDALPTSMTRRRIRRFILPTRS